MQAESLKRIGLSLILTFLATTVVYAQDTVDVDIPGFEFDPADITIEVGQTVRWTNNHFVAHTTTSTDDPQVWDSGSMSQGDQFSFTFDTEGTYPYNCTFHPSQMQGLVEVVTSLAAGDDVILPEEFSVSQNYPNPFNPSTAISFNILRPAPVSVTILNLQGQVVTTLLDREMGVGEHTVHWDGSNSLGDGVSSGVYFYRVRVGVLTETRKMLLLK
jgi:plastocyanin